METNFRMWPLRRDRRPQFFLQDVGRYWTGLTATQQRAIHLVGIEGRSYEEAAAIEDVSLGTLKSRISRGRHTLLELLEGDSPPALAKSADCIGSSEPPSAESSLSVREMSPSDNNQIGILRAWRQQQTESRAEAAW
ncbi:sigma factor-like helix-turn-helix DNA-binding protein [Sphingomonas sp. Ant20]|uniref:sigma factor-like helix-turn-helix DNA-binding protein n=1 Tax=Sphingomonas sp. Ant20 TaxID=104605 RepID=UPI002740FE7F|nr:sigma factor-like helix-turn-helix DNA-binding protein [Sphingomonas sp. Ant20]